MVKTIVKIDGMMCSMCESHINETIRKAVPDAKKVQSSHKKGESSFLTEYIPDEGTLKNAIEATGYHFLSLHTEPYVKKGIFGF